MSKPTVYLDTNVISVMYYHGKDDLIIGQRVATWDWWTMERRSFKLHTSRWTDNELMKGLYRGKTFALAEARRLNYLPLTQEVRRCAQTYLDKIVPESVPGDALQLAFAAVNVIDYLMTWNQAHLARVDTQRRLHELNRKMKWNTPLLVTPATIPKVCLGEEIRRKREKERF